MSNKKITVQQIADELGLSRTTVSKVLNHAEGISEKTVSRVLKKARELQYKSFADNSFADNTPSGNTLSGDSNTMPRGNISLLAHVLPDNFHMASALMLSLEQALGQAGFSLTLHTVSDQNIVSCTLPNSFYIDNTEAVICLELFDRSYSEMLCSLGKPVLFSDIYSDFRQGDINADVIMMENRNRVFHMIDEIIKKNSLTSVGFVGDPGHCLSFRERYCGFLTAAEANHMPAAEKYSITGEDTLFSDDNWLLEQLKAVRQPDLFFCANDILATRLLSCLSRLNRSVPKDVLLCGFDGTPALSAVNPGLTTIVTPGREMGIVMAGLLALKIKNPGLPNTYIRMDTRIRYGASTRT